MPKVFDSKWKDLFIAGVGGGAIFGLADPLVKNLTSSFGNFQLAGIQLSDILMLVGTKMAADRTHGMVSTAFEGAAIIGLYKIVYQNFISPMLAGMTSSMGAATVPNLTKSLMEFATTQPYYVTP